MADAPEQLDLISESTRRTRRLLLGMAAILMVLEAYPSFRPTDISALGIKLTGNDSAFLAGALSLVTIYLLVSFSLCAMRDYGRLKPRENWRSVIAIELKMEPIKLYQTFFGFPRQTGAIVKFGPYLKKLRVESGTGWFGFAWRLAWVYLFALKNFFTSRIIVFWLLGFWFPVLFAGLSLVSAADKGVTVLSRIWTSVL